MTVPRASRPFRRCANEVDDKSDASVALCDGGNLPVGGVVRRGARFPRFGLRIHQCGGRGVRGCGRRTCHRARMDEQENVVIRIAADCKAVVWCELGRPPVDLAVETSAGRRQVTIPSIGAWNVGYIELR